MSKQSNGVVLQSVYGLAGLGIGAAMCWCFDFVITNTIYDFFLPAVFGILGVIVARVGWKTMVSWFSEW